MIQVIGNRILIKPDQIENPAEQYQRLSKFGFTVVQDEKRERAAQHIGTVVQIGHAAWFDYPEGLREWCKVGDKVVYARHAGKFLIDPENDEEFVIVNDNDVQCILKNKKGKK